MIEIPAGWPVTIRDVLKESLRSGPDREALITARERLTYRQLDERIERAMVVLHALGVRKGERVAASLPNASDIVIAFHATTRLGAVWVGINRQLAPPEKTYILRDSGAKVLLAEPAVAGSLGGQDLPGIRIVVIDGSTSDEWHAMLLGAGSLPELATIGAEDAAAIAYTSGTTGRPKGVVHSHHNLLVASRIQVATRPGYGSNMRKADFLALTILNAMALSTLIVSQAGGASILIDSSKPEVIADWILRERATCFQGLPAILYSMVAESSITPEHLGSLSEVLTGGSPTSEKLHKNFRDKFGLPLVGCYGLTEAPVTIVMELDGTDHVPGANGRALPHLDLYTEDENGTRLPPNGIGEICVRPVTHGPWKNVYTPMLAYWNQPDATREVLRGGALHTGDIGYLDDAGHVFILDRKNAMIIRGGSNVYPAEIERVLAADPRVVDSAVLGIPDERLGERVVAAVQLVPGAKASEEDLRELCLKELARYKVPEQFLFVETFPRNTMNKIVRAELKPLFGTAAALRT